MKGGRKRESGNDCQTPETVIFIQTRGFVFKIILTQHLLARVSRMSVEATCWVTLIDLMRAEKRRWVVGIP